MLRVGVAGMGFMGSMHFRNWKQTAAAEVVAVCDVEKGKLEGSAGTAGNIAGAEEGLDLAGVERYGDLETMLAEAQLDAVSLALPTYLHAENTIKALEAGVHVLCEKPMALSVRECEGMIEAARKSGKVLQVGHCIRFWPEYAKVKELIDGGEYGSVRAASFHRLSATPTWSWQGWLMDGAKGGGAALDLHIHDADFVQYVFGMPGAVFSRGVVGPGGDYDHMATAYVYENGPAVTAEGGWMMADGFGFRMSFEIVLEKATVVFDITREPAFQVHPVGGESFTPQVADGDGYAREIAHFARLVSGEKVAQILTPEQSQDSVRLIGAEKESARTGKVVAVGK